ncbi:hypothetical protein BACCAP_02438 [Pseudoflavonifractor capillosus ATCC 29799]|uniref:Uncharacterized protein n=1 Tax=Pseudoflavonifractor capillosus ATCC 29799 TaxID=411467 RepID=A6NW45_9FIRM|nr:hypothetical protein BACCAP_02438 [Pseudoflavonifractor capillosus ATCC 29799]
MGLRMDFFVHNAVDRKRSGAYDIITELKDNNINS